MSKWVRESAAVISFVTCFLLRYFTSEFYKTVLHDYSISETKP